MVFSLECLIRTISGINESGSVTLHNSLFHSIPKCCHLFVGHGGVGLGPHAEDLPEEDPEGPDVGLGGEDPVQEGLRGHPPHRKQRLAPLPTESKSIEERYVTCRSVLRIRVVYPVSRIPDPTFFHPRSGILDPHQRI